MNMNIDSVNQIACNSTCNSFENVSKNKASESLLFNFDNKNVVNLSLSYTISFVNGNQLNSFIYEIIQVYCDYILYQRSFIPCPIKSLNEVVNELIKNNDFIKSSDKKIINWVNEYNDLFKFLYTLLYTLNIYVDEFAICIGPSTINPKEIYSMNFSNLSKNIENDVDNQQCNTSKIVRHFLRDLITQYDVTYNKRIPKGSKCFFCFKINENVIKNLTPDINKRISNYFSFCDNIGDVNKRGLKLNVTVSSYTSTYYENSNPHIWIVSNTSFKKLSR